MLKKIITVSSFIALACASLISVPATTWKVDAATKAGPSKASSPTTTIDLNDNTDQEIRDYYSPLKGKAEGELKGTNILKNLKPVLMNDTKYFDYDTIWKIYEITDRDWAKSPASETTYGTYTAATNKLTSYQYGSNSNPKNNPYVHAYYRNYTDYPTESAIQAWGDHNITGINREHLWCQSRGFKAPSGAEGPAGTDLHHLVAADAKVNQDHHNNNPYGNVNVEDNESKSWGNAQPMLAKNKRGSAVRISADDVSSVVFEPQDCDKGDIARAIFYMAARYNNLSGTDTITQYEPNLLIVDYATSNANTSVISSASTPVTMGILSDLLEWNAKDPVDEYEIHRNNLIYKNYQYNRNPFIDFPEWADHIWGDKKDVPINVESDVINDGSDYQPETPKKLEIPLWVWIVSGVAAVLLITLVIVLAVRSKKFRKQAKRAVKKEIKKQTKKSTKKR